MAVQEADREVAEEIARQVEQFGGRRGGWFEVRALMARFDIERYSEEGQARMTEALEGAGLSLDPPLSQLNRRDTVVLTSARVSQDEPSGGDLDEVLTVRTLGDVRWFDIADSSRVGVREVLEALGPQCGGALDEEIVDDLLSPDPRPKVKSPAAGIRNVAAFRVTACESDEGAGPESESKAGVLMFEPVEFLLGDDWLITVWHDFEVFRGADRIREAPPAPPAELFAEVERCWGEGAFTTPGDLAVLVLHELALTYAPAYRQLYDWLEEWELDFYRRPDQIDRDTLLDVRASAAILRDWLGPLNPSGMRADLTKAWFPGITGSQDRGGHQRALRVNDRVDRALAELRQFNETLRSSYDLLELRQAERERERDDRFQRNVAVWGSAILIPTLVAGIMGANTWVPGQWGSDDAPHWAFFVLLAIILGSGVVAFAVIHIVQSRDERD